MAQLAPCQAEPQRCMLCLDRKNKSGEVPETRRSLYLVELNPNPGPADFEVMTQTYQVGAIGRPHSPVSGLVNHPMMPRAELLHAPAAIFRLLPDSDSRPWAYYYTVGLPASVRLGT